MIHLMVTSRTAFRIIGPLLGKFLLSQRGGKADCDRNQESGIIYARKFTIHAIYKRMHAVFIVHIDMGCWLL